MSGCSASASTAATPTAATRASSAARWSSASGRSRSCRGDGPGGGFTQARLAADRGAGVEIVLEVDDVAAALARVEAAGHPVEEPLRARPWGRTDIRLLDPDGYYLRITG